MPNSIWSTSLAAAVRGTAISMFAIIVFTEWAGIGYRGRLEHLGAYVGALGVAFVLHYLFALATPRQSTP